MNATKPKRPTKRSLMTPNMQREADAKTLIEGMRGSARKSLADAVALGRIGNEIWLALAPTGDQRGKYKRVLEDLKVSPEMMRRYRLLYERWLVEEPTTLSQFTINSLGTKMAIPVAWNGQTIFALTKREKPHTDRDPNAPPDAPQTLSQRVCMDWVAAPTDTGIIITRARPILDPIAFGKAIGSVDRAQRKAFSVAATGRMTQMIVSVVHQRIDDMDLEGAHQLVEAAVKWLRESLKKEPAAFAGQKLPPGVTCVDPVDVSTLPELVLPEEVDIALPPTELEVAS